MSNYKCVLVVADIRSSHNVGSMLRTCDGLGIDAIYLTGYTPYPAGQSEDGRLPHIAEKVTKDIHKTALGAETKDNWVYHPNTEYVLKALHDDGWHIIALEQAPESHSLTTIDIPDKIALVVGNEVTGIPPETLKLCDEIVEIDMVGQKESFNVSIAAAMALFWIKNN